MKGTIDGKENQHPSTRKNLASMDKTQTLDLKDPTFAILAQTNMKDSRIDDKENQKTQLVRPLFRLTRTLRLKSKDQTFTT